MTKPRSRQPAHARDREDHELGQGPTQLLRPRPGLCAEGIWDPGALGRHGGEAGLRRGGWDLSRPPRGAAASLPGARSRLAAASCLVQRRRWQAAVLAHGRR